MHDLGFSVPALPVQNGGKRREVARDVGMIVSQGALADRESVPRQRLRHVVPLARMLETGHIVIESGERRIVCAHVPARQTERARVRVGASVDPSLVLAHDPETVPKAHRKGAVTPARVTQQREGPPQAPSCFRIPSGEAVTLPERSPPPSFQNREGCLHLNLPKRGGPPRKSLDGPDSRLAQNRLVVVPGESEKRERDRGQNCHFRILP